LPEYSGSEIKLYRGECKFLFESGLIGFCWTRDINKAEEFASGLNSEGAGGVLIECWAPKDAILSGPNSHSNYLGESEYTCNPFKIESVKVLKNYDQWGRLTSA
jgi:hypothetical protein